MRPTPIKAKPPDLKNPLLDTMIKSFNLVIFLIKPPLTERAWIVF
jgi:hypothetical protein